MILFIMCNDECLVIVISLCIFRLLKEPPYMYMNMYMYRCDYVFSWGSDGARIQCASIIVSIVHVCLSCKVTVEASCTYTCTC